MLQAWDIQFPGRIETMFRSLKNVSPSHLVDRALYDFGDFQRQAASFTDGDIAFDQEKLMMESETLTAEPVKFVPAVTSEAGG